MSDIMRKFVMKVVLIIFETLNPASNKSVWEESQAIYPCLDY
jgi:hypothetical protein